MLSGTRSFIDQMSKMVGHEPRECSNGDSTLLPTYIVSHTHATPTATPNFITESPPMETAPYCQLILCHTPSNIRKFSYCDDTLPYDLSVVGSLNISISMICCHGFIH